MANGDISFWMLGNIQTLCTKCHIAKGKEDNARRRLARSKVATCEQIELLPTGKLG